MFENMHGRIIIDECHHILASNYEAFQVYDFVVDYITLKCMWAKREKGYKALGYTFDEQRSLELN